MSNFFSFHPDLSRTVKTLVRGLVLLSFLTLCAMQTSAQVVAFDLRFRHPSYVVGEPVIVQLKLENHSAQPIVIDDHKMFKHNRIFFEIRKEAHEVLQPLRARKIVDEIALEHDEAITVDIDLAEWYPLVEAGRYYIRPVLINNNRRYAADHQVIEIVPGIELANLKQIIRGRQLIERNFTLVYWARGKREDVFLRTVDKPTGDIWVTLPLGPIVRVMKPEMKQQGETEIIITHQASRDVVRASRIHSDAGGPRLVDQQTSIESAPEAVVDSLNEALEESRKKKSGRRRSQRKK